MGKIKVSIVITYYQDLRKLKETLDSIIKFKPNYVEVIVIDNSERGIIKNLNNYLNLIKYIKSHANLGYGAGNNLGIANASSSSEYIFILNPDTLIYKNTVQKLKSFLDKHKKAAVVAPNLLKPNGDIFSQMGSRILTPKAGIYALSFINKMFPKNKISEKYWLNDLDITKLRKVDVVPGSAIMIRKIAFEQIGGYDNNMFLFFEESDIGIRFKNANWNSYILPSVQVLHYWKYGRKSDDPLKKYFEQSRFYYFKKHFGLPRAVIVEVFAKLSKLYALFF